MFNTVKKIGVVIAIAVLFSFFAFSIVEAIKPSPRWEDYCYETMQAERVMKEVGSSCQGINVPQAEIDSCNELKGRISYTYDSLGCPTSYKCNACEAEYEAANKDFTRLAFIVSGIIGLIAVLLGLYIMPRSAPLEWVMSGLLIGGVIIIFRGTAIYFSELGRYLRPVVLLLEIALIVFIAVKIYRNRSN